MANQWLRLYSEFANDPKMQMMSESNQRRYIMLLCMRCSNGDVTLQNEEVAFQLRISNDEWLQTKALFVSKNIITEDNKPTAWERRQYASDSSAERVARYRAKQKQACNVTVTPQNRTEQNRTDNKKPSVAHEKIVFDGSSFQNINGQLKAWKDAFPAIDVEGEINRAAVWLIANPKNQKSNYARFLTAWMTRAQDKAPAKGGGIAPVQSGLLAGAL